ALRLAGRVRASALTAHGEPATSPVRWPHRPRAALSHRHRRLAGMGLSIRKTEALEGVPWRHVDGRAAAQAVRGSRFRLRARLKPERPLRRLGRPDAHTFQLQHADLRRGAARRRKAADLAAGRQHAMARNDQRHGIARHRLADVARRFRSGAELFRQRAIGRRLAVPDLAECCVDAPEEILLAGEVDLDVRKIDLLAGEVAPGSGDDAADFRWGCGALSDGYAPQ